VIKSLELSPADRCPSPTFFAAKFSNLFFYQQPAH
jgi:hypothetical protein